MAVNNVRNIAPFINDNFLITSPWWNYREDPVTHETKLHRGLDIATSGKRNVYSMLTGIVHSIGTDSTRGNWIIIKDDDEESPYYGYATLYMHLDKRPLLVVGQHIDVNQYVGLEGSTGKSTGVHLHVEMQDLNRWNNEWHTSNIKEDYINVPEFMGIDNIKNTWWKYDGTPPTPPPRPPIHRENHFPWVLYANKLRKR